MLLAQQLALTCADGRSRYCVPAHQPSDAVEGTSAWAPACVLFVQVCPNCNAGTLVAWQCKSNELLHCTTLDACTRAASNTHLWLPCWCGDAGRRTMTDHLAKTSQLQMQAAANFRMQQMRTEVAVVGGLYG